MLNFQIQNHKPLREMVYDSLKMQILTGKIVPGTRMMEVELAEEMGVSRTPIREAIRKLEKEGLVTIEPRRGAYASEVSNGDIVEILEVRQELEGMATQHATERITAEEIAELRSINARYEKAVLAGNTTEMIELDTKFHTAIVDACANKILVNMVAQLREQVLRFRYIYYDDFKRASNMPMQHAKIIDAMEAGSSQDAREAAEFHIFELKELVEHGGIQQKHI